MSMVMKHYFCLTYENIIDVLCSKIHHWLENPFYCNLRVKFIELLQTNFKKQMEALF